MCHILKVMKVRMDESAVKDFYLKGQADKSKSVAWSK